MSRFAVRLHPMGRVEAILGVDDSAVGPTAVGAMLGSLLASPSVPHFYEMLVELEERGVLARWRLGLATDEPGDGVPHRFAGARDGQLIVLAAQREERSDDSDGSDGSDGSVRSDGSEEFAAWLVRIADNAGADPGACKDAAAVAGLLRRTARRVADRHAQLADARVEIAALQRLVSAPARLENELVRKAAHDLRNPLLVVAMNCSFLLDQSQSLIGDDRELLADCVTMCEQAGRLLDSMRSLAGFSIGRFELARSDTDVTALVRELAGGAARSAEQADIAVTTGRLDPVTLAVDPDRLRFAVSELIENAVKFCPAGSSVTVTVERDDAVRIAVTDDGPGVPPELHESLFHPFGKPRSEHLAPGKYSAGVGLAIVRRIAEAHGGQVAVAAGPDGGARFEVILPSAP